MLIKKMQRNRLSICIAQPTIQILAELQATLVVIGVPKQRF